MAKASVKAYSGEKFLRVRLGPVRRKLPLVRISPHMWIASDAEFILGDVELISAAARIIARKVGRGRTDVVLTAEAKSIALAFELSKNLGHKRFVVARKSLKSYMSDHVVQPLRSITTDSQQELLLTAEEMDCIAGKKVCILDDVVSTGGTLAALQTLVDRAEGTVVCKAAIWKEGPWYKGRDLVFVEELPVFVEPGSPLASQVGA